MEFYIGLVEESMYGYETLSLTLRLEYNIKMFEIRLLSTFDPSDMEL
jgi:hypothetical protein